MRIDVRYGSDTGMEIVYAFLETPEERALDENAIWHAVNALVRADGIDSLNVVDVFTRIKNGQGEWVSAIRNADGKLVPVPW